MGQLDMQSGADVVALDAERQRRAAESDEALSTAGGMLRAAREALGWDTGDVARRTNIKEQHIASIEAMAIESLPSQPYTMGFVRAYAREVRLPDEALMARFRSQAGYQLRDRVAGASASRRRSDMNDGKELSAVVLLAVVGFVVFCAWKLLISAAPVTDDGAGRFAFSKDDRESTVVSPGAYDDPVADVPAPTVEAFSNTRAPAAAAGGGPAADPVVTDGLETPMVADGADSAATVVEEAASVPVAVLSLRRLAAVDPVYPPLCEGAAAEIETVTVAFTIDGRGRPVSRRITQSSNPCFNGAALAALERWRYDPATITDATRAQSARFTFDRPY